VHLDIAWGNAMIDYAWEARGSGYANTVGADSFQLFGERLRSADVALQEAAAADPSNPALWETMLRADRGLGTPVPTQREHFKKAQLAAPHDFGAAATLAINLLPRWYGHPGEVETLLTELSAKPPTDMDGDEVYCQVGAQVLTYGGGTQQDTHLDWARMRKGFQKLDSKRLAFDNLATEMLLGAALLKDSDAALFYYERHPRGFNSRIISTRYMGTVCQWLGKPALTAKEDIR
jgi:hypothetical protein